MDSLKRLQDACNASGGYPCNALSTKVGSRTLCSLQQQLHQRSRDLFCKEPDANLRLLELARLDEGYQSYNCVNYDSLRLHLDGYATQCRPDPRQRFVFIEAPNSREPFEVTEEMFTYLMTYLQVMPMFLELLFPFGNQHYARGFHFSGIHVEQRTRDEERGCRIDELGRSGRHLQICYSLKSAEQTHDRSRWSIRQCAVYNQFDLETSQTVWVVAKGNEVIQEQIRGVLRGEEPEHQRCPGLAVSLKIHALIAAWASEEWQWYINDLESEFQVLTRSLLVFTFQSGPPKLPGGDPEPAKITRQSTVKSITDFAQRSFSWSTWNGRGASTMAGGAEFAGASTLPRRSIPSTAKPASASDLPKVHGLLEKAMELELVMTSNITVLGRLQSEFNLMKNSNGADTISTPSAQASLADFDAEIEECLCKLRLQVTRARTLISLVRERKGMLDSILQFQALQASLEFAENAQISTYKMEDIARKTVVETVSMRIITIVTLFFLPGTFISTLMSTDIVSFQDPTSALGWANIGFGALKLFVALSLPLAGLTFALWFFVDWREKQRQKQERQKISSGVEKV